MRALQQFRSLSKHHPPRPFAFFAVLLLCMGAYGTAWAEDEMTFEQVGPKAIAASGRITEQTPALFINAVQRAGGGRGVVVYLDSPGGSVLGSLAFGTMMRRAGATAVVAKASSGFFGTGSIEQGECFSACVYALIGASRRVIPLQSLVGIHKMFLAIEGGTDVTAYASRAERSEAGGIRVLLSRYSARMGVSPELIALAERTPSYNIHVLTRAEIRRYRLGAPN